MGKHDAHLGTVAIVSSTGVAIDTFGGDVTSVTPGTGATNLGKAEDAAHASGDIGVEMLAVRRDTPAASGANGDYVTQNQGAFGQQWTGMVDPVAGTALKFAASVMTPGQNTLSTAAEVVIAANAARIFAEVKNMDAAITMYFGFDATLTTGNGYPLFARESFSFEGYTGAIWMIAASGTPVAGFIEV